MKNLLMFLGFSFIGILPIFAQQEQTYKTEQIYKNWVKQAPNFADDFYKTDEAKRIADNVLLYQLNTGGWPKNIYMPKELTEAEKKRVIADKSNVDEGTIDNNATTTEIQFLAKVYNSHKDDKYKQAVLDGINYLLEAQYDNGGWPQCYPRTKGYVTQIQYNDNSNVNVLKFMREIANNKNIYSFVPDTTIKKVQNAFDKGIDCILKTQVRQNGVLTAWCAQYDHVSLKPDKARAYELISLSGQESDNIVLLLMSLKNPSKEVIAAVEGAVVWFNKVQIKGFKVESFVNEEGKNDRKLVPCEECPSIWARFYDIETNEPFVCDRDGIKRQSLSEIGYERRNGYKWYNDDGQAVLEKYEIWKGKLKSDTHKN